MPSSPRKILAASAALLALAGAGSAAGAWSLTTGGNGFTRAATLPAGNQPLVSISGFPDVAVNWTAVTVGGAAVDSYTVRRYSEAGALQTIGAACSTAIALLTCTESGVPVGRWQYTVLARKSNWAGSEGARSRVIEVAAAPTRISCPNCHSFAGTSYVNAAIRAAANIHVSLPASSLATDTVNLALADAAGHQLVTSVAAPNGAGPRTFSNLDTSTLQDGNVTVGSYVGANTGDVSPTTQITLVRDTVAPTATNISGTNGDTARTMDDGDAIVYAFSEAPDPGSILSGWSASSTSVAVSVSAADVITVDSTNLGSVAANANYAKKAFSCPTSTMVLSDSVVTVALGGCSTAKSRVNSNVANSAFSWTPTSTITDRAGNPMSTTAASESGGSQANF